MSVAEEVERYAFLCAEREATPADARTIERAYGILTDRARTDLERLWQLRFARDPDVEVRFEKAYDLRKATIVLASRRN